MGNPVVGSMSEWAGVLKDFFRQIEDGSKTLEQVIAFNENRNPFAPGVADEWINEIIKQERKFHRDFFGSEFDLAKFENTLRKYGRKKIREWKKLGLEPHFLPKVSMMAGEEYPGWKVKPEDWFYKIQVEGKLFLNASGQLTKMTTIGLEGITVLIDTRLKPAYSDGKQMYEKDNLLGPIIEKLRRENRIARYEYGPQNSRFGVSSNEIDSEIRAAFAEKIGLSRDMVRLEKTIEANTIPQIYSHMPRMRDGQTNTWVWYEEFFGGCDGRLGGGYSDSGGLAGVGYSGVGHRWDDRSFRLLAVLV